jgi:membrane protease YdiL (CAAX protease family)
MNQEKMKTSVSSFLFHGPLAVPKWSEFWWRYLLLLCLGVAVFGLTLCRPIYLLWLEWDQGAGTVTSFGITLHPENAAVDFQAAVNDVYRGTVGALGCAYVLSVVGAYGLRRFWAHVSRAATKRMALYIVVISAILILGGYLFEWFGIYSGDPKSVQRKSVLAILLIGVVGPIKEEMFARFTLYQMIRAKSHFLVAGTLSSLVFGLLHFGWPEPIKMLMAGLAGVFLCWSYERTGCILTPIGIHVLTNLWMLQVG